MTKTIEVSNFENYNFVFICYLVLDIWNFNSSSCQNPAPNSSCLCPKRFFTSPLIPLQRGKSPSTTKGKFASLCL
jgi:hypothetical protein